MVHRQNFHLELDDELLAFIFKLFGRSATVKPDAAFSGSFTVLPNSTLILDPNYPVTYHLSFGSTALIPDPAHLGTFTIGSE